MLPLIAGPCSSDGCERRAVTLAYFWNEGLAPVCRRHLCTYRVSAGLWQCEDEAYELRFARRARWRWLAQWRVLLDQRAARAGRESFGQRRMRVRRDGLVAA